MNSYFRLALIKLKVSFICIFFMTCLAFLCFFITSSLIRLFYNFFLLTVLLILFTLVLCCGFENRDISLVSKM